MKRILCIKTKISKVLLKGGTCQHVLLHTRITLIYFPILKNAPIFPSTDPKAVQQYFLWFLNTLWTRYKHNMYTNHKYFGLSILRKREYWLRWLFRGFLAAGYIARYIWLYSQSAIGANKMQAINSMLIDMILLILKTFIL